MARRSTAAGAWLTQVAAWSVILAAIAALTAAVLVPRLVGATPYAVLSGSMEPTYPPGTLVVVRPLGAADLGVGDVITYQLESGQPEVATHRIVSRGVNGRGEHWFRTQGDANGSPDPQPVREVQVKGRVWYAVPYVGHLNDLINGSRRQVALYLVVTGLLGYAAFMFVGAVRDRRSRRTGATEAGDPETPDAERGVAGQKDAAR